LITSAGPVNDGNWHHVVLTTSTSAQTLYLDGSAGASIGNCSPGKYNPFVCWALDPSSLGDIVMLCNLYAQNVSSRCMPRFTCASVYRDQWWYFVPSRPGRLGTGCPAR
jgi:hypothetical protein